MYALDGFDDALYKDTATRYRESHLARLSKELGLGLCGPRTLQRRCLTTFDETGNPVIHLRESDPYRLRPRKASDEQIIQILTEQGIQIDRVPKGDTVEAYVKPSDRFVDVSLSEVSAGKLTRQQKIPSAVLSGVNNIGEGIDLKWVFGNFDAHDRLFEAALGGHQRNKHVDLRIGDTTFKLRAIYQGQPGEKEGEFEQLIFWLFKGNKRVFEQHLPEILAMIQVTELTLGRELGNRWDADPSTVKSLVALTVPGEGENPNKAITYDMHPIAETNDRVAA